MLKKSLMLLSFLAFSTSYAAKIKPSYCDTSAGRLVLSNGDYSKYYCRYDAIMDYQNLHGCCSWSGGVFLVKLGNVICRDGSISAVCSLQSKNEDEYNRSDNSIELSDEQW